MNHSDPLQARFAHDAPASHAQAGGDRAGIRKCEVRMDRMVRSVMLGILAGYPATRITFSELPIIDADPDVVNAVLVHVIANAFRLSAQAPRPEVEVSIDATGALQVIDNGPRFARHAAPDLGETGTLLARQGGSVRVDPRRDERTRVTISFGN